VETSIVCACSYFRRFTVAAVGDIYVAEAANDGDTYAVPPG